jgi:uncharacterized membrane protein YhaH (DUF805 family)
MLELTRRVDDGVGLCAVKGIGRQTYWIGAIALVVASIVISFIFGRFLTGAALTVFAIIWQLALSYPAYNLMAKRFHDRDKPSTYALYVIIAFFVLAVISLLTAPVPGESPGAISIVFGLVSLAIGIWILVELGILRGTVGANQYGPDPVGMTP